MPAQKTHALPQMQTLCFFPDSSQNLPDTLYSL